MAAYRPCLMVFVRLIQQRLIHATYTKHDCSKTSAEPSMGYTLAACTLLSIVHVLTCWNLLMQAQPSGRLSDSDVYAITHAESAAQAKPPGESIGTLTEHRLPMWPHSTRPEQHLRGAQKPALLQLQDLANADAMTPQDKRPRSRLRAAADSPQGDASNSPLWDAASSTGRIAADAQSNRPPALAQLRALAGVADSPQTPHQIGKSANQLTDLASVPLSQWQFGNTGTAHAVWQPDNTPAMHPAAGAGGLSASESVNGQATPGYTGAESSGGRAASPSWGPAEPPQPVHLEIKVLGDGDSSDRSPALRAASNADSLQEDGSPAMRKSLGADSFGFEAGYASHSSAPSADHQSSSTALAAVAAAAATAVAASGSAGMHGGKTSKAPGSTAEGIFADDSDTGANGKTGTGPIQATTFSASAPLQTTGPPPTHSTTAAAAASAASVTHQGGPTLNPNPNPVSGAGALGRHPIGSAGADELAEAAAHMAGSPWDPRQGPKLLESLSDFSSFNSSLSMLQQLAGKSAAGLATLGIGSSSSSSSQRVLEKKKSDKGHLISSAPTAWWRRRPGSAKKSPAPQVGPGSSQSVCSTSCPLSMHGSSITHRTSCESEHCLMSNLDHVRVSCCMFSGQNARFAVHQWLDKTR